MNNLTKKLCCVLLFLFFGFTVLGGDKENDNRVRITNKTGFVITGNINYVSGGLSCTKDYTYTVNPGETFVGPDYACLISSITGSYQVAVGVRMVCPAPGPDATPQQIVKYNSYLASSLLGNEGECPWEKVLALSYETKKCKSYDPSSSSYKNYEIVQDAGEVQIIRVGGGWTSWVQKQGERGTDYVTDAAKRTAAVATAVANSAEELAKAGINTASKEFKDLSKNVTTWYEAGVDKISYLANAAYEWLDENACSICLTAAISAGVVYYFSPTQPSVIATSTALSTKVMAAINGVANWATNAAKRAAVGYTLATLIVEPFLLIPGVEGHVNKTLLINVIANCISTSLSCGAPCWGTPAGVGVVIGAAVAPVISTLICKGICPKGFTKAVQ